MRRLVKRVFRRVGYDVYRLDRADVGSIARPVGNMQVFLEHLRAQDLVPESILDVGANKGQWSRVAKSVFPTANCFLIKPQAGMRSYLDALRGGDNAVRKLGSTEVFILEISLFRFMQGQPVFHEVIAFMAHRAYLAYDFPGFHQRPYDDALGQKMVLSVTIDKYCQYHDIRCIDYLKVDVEGAELDVPKGCSRLLEQRAIRYIQFEVSQAMIKGMERDGSEISKLLSDFGYKCHPISESGDLLPLVTITDAFFANFITVPG